MKKPWYAHGARKLLAARQAGLMPDRTVYVSMTDRQTPNALSVKRDMPADRLDWRMLVNLDVQLLADRTVDLGWLLDTTSRIAHVRPAFLGIVFEDEGVHDVEVGTGTHIPEVLELPAQHSFTWVPINCSGTLTGSRLRQALIAKHSRWTVL